MVVPEETPSAGSPPSSTGFSWFRARTHAGVPTVNLALSIVLVVAAVAAALAILVALTFIATVSSSYMARALYLGAARPTLNLGEWISLVVREAIAQARIVGWHLSRRGAGPIMGAIPGDPSDDHIVPVVLAHGMFADGTSMWMLRKGLADCGRPTYAPHLGRILRSVERYAEALEQAIDRALVEHPRAEGFDVVAHSLGGIALRHCLSQRPDLARRVRRVVTIASPHSGTRAATHLPVAEARMLFPGAAWLLLLPSLRALLPQAAITTISSRHDAIVYPYETCCVEGATHHQLDHVGHAELLLHPRVVDLVQSSLS